MMQTICDKYVVLECLHKNKSNQVFLVEHISLGSKRIIKKMKKEKNFQLSEVEVLKKLMHFNIPKIIDVMEDEEDLYLIREYAEGKDLEAHLAERGRFPEEELVAIAGQLADALQYLHEGLDRPLIYRDLKPENIILDDKGHLSLIDFGIARFSGEERKQDTMFLGTKAYASPEQFGVLKSDEKSDIYSFGMTLYYLLGKHKITEFPYKRLEKESWFPDYSEEFISLIYDCSEPQRDIRPKNFAEIKKKLNEIEKKETMGKHIPSNAEIYMGIRHGVGTSFITFAKAFQASEAGKKVALLDWSESQQISKLSYISPKAQIKKYSFILGDLEIFPISRGRTMPENYLEYDIIFIDYGVFEPAKKLETKQWKERVRIVSAGALWDVVDLDEVMFNEKLIEYHFILNMAEKELADKLAEDYPHTTFEHFCYQKKIQEDAAEAESKEKKSKFRFGLLDKLHKSAKGRIGIEENSEGNYDSKKATI
ncbi:MAG: serine/threonine-protein kinase [Eubacteriales bacterium]|nr:serine/threonine-protein kinase [Eubacteriales bacterium]